MPKNLSYTPPAFFQTSGTSQPIIRLKSPTASQERLNAIRSAAAKQKILINTTSGYPAPHERKIRYKEIKILLKEGKKVSEIADLLGISRATTYWYIRRIKKD